MLTWGKLANKWTVHSRAAAQYIINVFSSPWVQYLIAKSCLNYNKVFAIKMPCIHVLHATNKFGQFKRMLLALFPHLIKLVVTTNMNVRSEEHITITKVIANLKIWQVFLKLWSPCRFWLTWSSREEFFLLEVGIESALSIILQQEKTIVKSLRCYQIRVKHLKRPLEKKNINDYEHKSHTMYPNSILDSFAWMMDHSPQRKCDANAYLQ